MSLCYILVGNDMLPACVHGVIYYGGTKVTPYADSIIQILLESATLSVPWLFGDFPQLLRP